MARLKKKESGSPWNEEGLICVLSDLFFFFFFFQSQRRLTSHLVHHSRLYSATFRCLPNLANVDMVIRHQ
jgi:hypothetical protein